MKFLKIMGIVIASIVVLVVIAGFWAYYKGKPAKLAQFIRDNPERASIYLVRNDSVLADLNSDRPMPLASTMKIIIAIEYARQVASGRISPDEMVDLTEPEKYYIPRTDGNAHPNWLQDMRTKNLVKDGKIRLEEIAKGMIQFSSNANTEYLMEKLGLDSINANLPRLGLVKHQVLYPIVSALLVCKGATRGQLLQMPVDDYRKYSYEIHNRLKTKEISYKDSVLNVPMDVQKIWSDRLPASTTKEYVSILQKINSRKYFDSVTQKNIEILMEGVMKNPKNQAWLVHAGMKGGSTAFVLTMATYATTKTGETTEVAYFFNDLTISENLFWQTTLNDFHLALLTNKTDRDEIVAILNSRK